MGGWVLALLKPETTAALVVSFTIMKSLLAVVLFKNNTAYHLNTSTTIETVIERPVETV